MDSLLSFIVSGVILGGAVEALSYGLKWWVFSVPGFAILQILFVEGLAMGTLAWYLVDHPPSTQYILSALVGGTLEVLNAAWFDLWEFPGNTFLIIQGKPWIVLVLTVFWGLYCPLIIRMGGRLLSWWRARDGRHPRHA